MENKIKEVYDDRNRLIGFRCKHCHTDAAFSSLLAHTQNCPHHNARKVHFNELTPAQAERLAILSEEMGEAQQVIGKILRHGLNSYDPIENNPAKNNAHLLAIEIADILHAIDLLVKAKDVMAEAVELRLEARPTKIKPYLHHQEQRP